MSKLYLSYILILTFIISGCIATEPEHSIGAGKNAYIENDMLGTYEGVGIVKGARGNILRTFEAEMLGYKDQEVIFVRETYLYNDGKKSVTTYRITPTESPYHYSCIRIEDLESCSVKRAGGTISLNINSVNAKMTNVDFEMLNHAFHFLTNDKMIKHTYYNKLLFLHDVDEIVHYTRVLQ